MHANGYKLVTTIRTPNTLSRIQARSFRRARRLSSIRNGPCAVKCGAVGDAQIAPLGKLICALQPIVAAASTAQSSLQVYGRLAASRGFIVGQLQQPLRTSFRRQKMLAKRGYLPHANLDQSAASRHRTWLQKCSIDVLETTANSRFHHSRPVLVRAPLSSCASFEGVPLHAVICKSCFSINLKLRDPGTVSHARVMSV